MRPDCQLVLDAYCATAQPACDGGKAQWDTRRRRWGCFRRNGRERCFYRGHQIALALELCNATLRSATMPHLHCAAHDWPANERLQQESISVIVTAAHVASHPLVTVINRSLTSLILLRLPAATPIFLAHDWPADSPRHGLPGAYAQYLDRLRAMLPSYSLMTGYAPRLLIQQKHGNLIGSLVLALELVQTAYVLKLEHDVEFIREVDMMSVLRDMRCNTELKFIRFNHRANSFHACDRGYFGENRRNKELFADYNMKVNLSNGYTRIARYTRTVCFADRAHLTSTDYYRDLILTPLVRMTPCVGPETFLQPFVAMDHAKYGTFIFGHIGAPPLVHHIDDPGRRSGWLNLNMSRPDRALSQWCAWFHSTWWCIGGCRRVHRITSKKERRWPFAKSLLHRHGGSSKHSQWTSSGV